MRNRTTCPCKPWSAGPLGLAGMFVGLLAGILVAVLGASPALGGDAAVRAILFDGLEAGASTFNTVGIKAAPNRVDREGFAGIASLGTGLRVERGSPLPAARAPVLVRMTLAGAALVGHQWFFERGVVGLFAGPEFSREMLVGGPGKGRPPTRLGLRIHGEVWVRPSAGTFASATLILGSARAEAYGRVSAGYRVWGAYLGPEASAYADRTGYALLGLGLHATEFAFGDLMLRASAGALYEPGTGRLGPYLSLAGWIAL